MRPAAATTAPTPELDPSLRVNLVWPGPGKIEHEVLGPIPAEITALMREVSTTGELVEQQETQ